MWVVLLKLGRTLRWIRNESMLIRILEHLRNPINVRQIELLAICLYSEGSDDRFVVVQHFWCQIVCRVSRKWIESKFLDQDVDVVSFANKGIVIGRFVSRKYTCNTILMETGKLTGNIRVTKNGLGPGVERMFKWSDSAFYHFTDRLNPFRKSVEFDILFLGPLPNWRKLTTLEFDLKFIKRKSYT